jgi:hypothetical protein
MRNEFLSSNTRLRPFSMNASNRDVNWFIRLRKSSKPKLMPGSWSAIEGTSCEARIELLRDGSKVVILNTVCECICGLFEVRGTVGAK